MWLAFGSVGSLLNVLIVELFVLIFSLLSFLSSTSKGIVLYRPSIILRFGAGK
jgi:hypothetical protein